MADNYLERKMEEHRLNKTQRLRSSLPVKGKISFNFPPKRVIINRQDDQLTKALIKAFAEAGCKVAIYIDSATDMTSAGGARVIGVTGNVHDDLANVIKSWGDVDIIISSSVSPVIHDLISEIADNRSRLPYPNDYGMRLITIDSHDNKYSEPEPGITTNHIIVPDITDQAISRKTALAALFISLPEMSGVNSSTLIIT